MSIVAEPPRSTPMSPEAIMVDVLPEDERRLLRAGAVLRFITRDLAELATGTAADADKLVSHPLVQASDRSEDQIWTMPEPLRRELIRSNESDAASTWQRVSTSDDTSAAIYAMLSMEATRTEGLRRLGAEFEKAIDPQSPAVGRAHDLLRLLDDWPVSDHADAVRLRNTLQPRLRRYSRALRDREATENYFERDFEGEILDSLLSADDRWMLHIHAPGGRGKSMFLKNLLGRTCPVRDIPVAWIDFDHIDRLGVNTTQPWRLLLSVARQLDSQLPHTPFAFMLDAYGQYRAVMHSEPLPRQASALVPGDSSTPDDLMAQAAAEVPHKFRSELRLALDTEPVIIALDTVENVQHADGATIDPVLEALAAVRNGDGGTADRGAAGLRVIVSGRFDLRSEVSRLDGTRQPRSSVFVERLVGPSPASRSLGGTTIYVGEQALSVELPPFSDEEAHRYLTRAQLDPDVSHAVVRRSRGNPMKLALFVEYIALRPYTTSTEIDDFQSVELAYLVTRVVDRISSGLVQWLLRWGALMRILTKEVVHQIIWPALAELAERGSAYDDATKIQAPGADPGVQRWKPPSVAEVRTPGAADATWEKLLTYAATSSWVSTLDDVPNAVQFHAEVREPLRNLLRLEGNPVLEDIHERALTYWRRKAGEVDGQERIVALRSMVFHAYESSAGSDYGDEIWLKLINEPSTTRVERGELAEELIFVFFRLDEIGRPLPSPESVSLAHLERAEFLVHDATARQRPVDESGLSGHRHAISPEVRSAHQRRVTFLDAAMALALDHPDEAWRQLDASLRQPTPRGQDVEGLRLIVEWALSLTPPPSALATAELLRHTAAGTTLARPACVPLARGLLATEQWTEALAVAREAQSSDLVATALLALGRAHEILGDPSLPAWAHAAAALLNLDTKSALRIVDTASGRVSGTIDPSVFLLRGQALALRRDIQPARTALSLAASGSNPAVAQEANLLLSRLQAVTGELELSASGLSRTLHDVDSQALDPVAFVRAEALDAVVNRGLDPARSAEAARRAYEYARRALWLPPSVRVELECAQLAVTGPRDDLLADLADALARVEGPAARLRALQWLAEVPTATENISPYLRDRLRALTDVALDPARTPLSLLLTRAELERVLNDQPRAREILDILAEADTGDPDTLLLAVDDARHRLTEDETGWRSFLPAEEETMTERPGGERDAEAVLQITSLKDSSIVVEPRWVTYPDDTVEKPRIPAEFLGYGPRSLFADFAGVIETLSGALLTRGLGERLRQLSSSVLALEIHDEAAARWPWEVALSADDAAPASTGVDTIVRTGRRGLVSSPNDPVSAPEVLVSIFNERKDRGLLAEVMLGGYGQYGRCGIYDPRELFGTRHAWAGFRLLHLVVDPIERRRSPALQLPSGDHLTAEQLAEAIDPQQPTLLILDLVLLGSDSAAAEQVMLANAFCWHVVRNTSNLSVLCGVFAAANDRIPQFQQLVDGLGAGVPLDELTGSLQQSQAVLQPKTHPVRELVSLSTDTIRRRFRFGSG